MTIDDKISDEKLKYDTHTEDEIDKYVYLTAEETLPPRPSLQLKPPKFTYSRLEKHLKNR